MPFEFDPAKSTANKAKHGVDFVEAQALWNDPDLFRVDARVDDEPRFFAIGLIGSRMWTAICVARHENVRLISVRRSRKGEVEAYERGRA